MDLNSFDMFYFIAVVIRIDAQIVPSLTNRSLFVFALETLFLKPNGLSFFALWYNKCPRLILQHFSFQSRNQLFLQEALDVFRVNVFEDCNTSDHCFSLHLLGRGSWEICFFLVRLKETISWIHTDTSYSNLGLQGFYFISFICLTPFSYAGYIPVLKNTSNVRLSHNCSFALSHSIHTSLRISISVRIPSMSTVNCFFSPVLFFFFLILWFMPLNIYNQIAVLKSLGMLLLSARRPVFTLFDV